MHKSIQYQIEEKVFRNFSENLFVYLLKSFSYGSNYDPYREEGGVFLQNNPIAVKGIVRQISGDSLIRREIGIQETGAVEVIIKERDISLIKNAEKVIYNQEEYALYNKALGSRMQIFKRPFGFYKVIMFKVA